MAKYSAVKATVNAYIKQNGRKEITGRILNAVLNATIDSLGKYFQFAGEALPTDDPGTPDQNLTYLAGTAGTYTNFGGLTLDTQEIALLMWDGEWKKQTLLFGIQEVDASVDNQVGTPSVDVDFENNVLTLSFHNIKGDKGDTGDPAGFGQVTASVDDTIGNPSVQVQTSGEDTAKNIAFEFHGLRGETGITSVVVSVDNTTGNPACSVSLVGQVLHLDFTGLKGLKGDTGVSADYPITIYNGLDSDATDQALSAAQGNVLDGKIGQLGQEVTGNIVKDVTWSNGYVQSTTGLIKTSSLSQFSQPILLKAGETVRIGTQNSNIGIICSTNADSVAVGDTVTVIKATSSSGQYETYEYTADADIKIVICVLASNYNLSFYDDDNLTKKVSNAATKQELISLGQDVDELDTFKDSANRSFVQARDIEKDLLLADKNGNVLVKFSNGHIKTKNFDSSSLKRGVEVIQELSPKDLNISDENGKTIFRVVGGYPQTKFFSHQLFGKRISVIGDSISTFAYTTSGDYSGCINPNINYFQSSNTDVHNPEDTWFGQLATKSGAIINRVASYGGGDVATTLKGYYNKVYSNGTSGNAPDVVFVFAGINDWGHNTPLGTLDDYKSNDTSTFYGAYCYLLDKLQETFPNADIYAMTPIYSAYLGTGIPYDTKNSAGYTIRDIADAIKEICGELGVRSIDTNKDCGLNRHNYSLFMFDQTHPKRDGLGKIANVVFNKLK